MNKQKGKYKLFFYRGKISITYLNVKYASCLGGNKKKNYLDLDLAGGGACIALLRRGPHALESLICC